MKSIFEKKSRDEIIHRINLLHENSQALWGEMNVTQMMKHCALCEEYYFGNIKIKRSFRGRFIGQSAIKKILKDEESSFEKNAPTRLTFKVAEDHLDFTKERENWKQLIEQYANFPNQDFIHWFFGELTKEQLGQFIFKHCKHHLNQFGV